MPLNSKGDCSKCKRAGRTDTASMCSECGEGYCTHCDGGCQGCKECENCGDPADHFLTTSDDVDLCEDCYRDLPPERKLTLVPKAES